MIHLSRETEGLARRLAAAEDLSVEDVIRLALEERTRAFGAAPDPSRPRDRSAQAIARRHERIDMIVKEIKAMPVLDRRSPHEIMDDLDAL